MKQRITIIVLALLFNACQKQAELKPKEYPFILTHEVEEINETGVTLKAELQNKGSQPILDYGFQWGFAETIFTKSLKGESNPENFSLRVSSDLTENQEYFCRAYVQNSQHFVLGNEIRFRAQGCLPPVIYNLIPDQGYRNSEAVLTGKNFSILSWRNKLLIGSEIADVMHSTFDTIIFKVPANVEIGMSTVSVVIGLDTCIAEQSFNVLGIVIDSLSTYSALPGDTIKLFGKEFNWNQNELQIFFGDYDARICSLSNNEMEVIVPISNKYLQNEELKLAVKDGIFTIYPEKDFIIQKTWNEAEDPPFYGLSMDYQPVIYHGNAYVMSLSKRLYKYDPVIDDWSICSQFPGTPKHNDLHIVWHDNMFKFIEHYENGNYYSELWQYNFLSNDWQQKDTVSFEIDKATTFLYQDAIYILNSANQLWKFDPTLYSYTRKNDLPQEFEFCYSYKQDEKVFVITNGKTWQYKVQSDEWLMIETNPFSEFNPNRATFGFQRHSKPYLLHLGSFLYCYNSTTKEWVLVSKHPGGSNDNKASLAFENQTFIANFSADYYKLLEYIGK